MKNIKYMLFAMSSVMATMSYCDKTCDMTKDYSRVSFSTSADEVFADCEKNYPNDVESCFYCRFEGFIAPNELNNKLAKYKQSKVKKKAKALAQKFIK